MIGNKRFVLGLSNKYNEYIIYYINEVEDSRLVYLRRYDDSSIAIDDLTRYSLIGTSDVIGSEILNTIQVYINNGINIHDFIRSVFTTFKYNETPEFQEIINVIDNIEDSDNNLIYKSRLQHLVNCIYPDAKELEMYVAMYYLSESIYSSLTINTLYDPSNSMASIFISQIMSIFHYTSNEVCEC